MRKIVVTANWDDEAKVWVATSEDIQGLAMEAKSCDALVKKLMVVIPELLDANGIEPTGNQVPVEVVSKLSMMAKVKATA